MVSAVAMAAVNEEIIIILVPNSHTSMICHGRKEGLQFLTLPLQGLLDAALALVGPVVHGRLGGAPNGRGNEEEDGCGGCDGTVVGGEPA